MPLTPPGLGAFGDILGEYDPKPEVDNEVALVFSSPFAQ